MALLQTQNSHFLIITRHPHPQRSFGGAVCLREVSGEAFAGIEGAEIPGSDLIFINSARLIFGASSKNETADERR